MTRTRGRVAAAAGVAAILAAVALIPASSSARSPRGTATLTQQQAQALGTQAYEYGIPLMEFVRQAKQQTSVTVPNSLSDAPVNQIGSARHLANASNQVIVQPNNDTLYTMGHLDLSKTALVLHVPRVPNHRYYSFEFLNPYTNVFHYVGTRTTGDGPGNYLITAPRWKGHVPAGVKRIRSSYRHVWLVGRTLVYGPSDLPAVYRIQNGYKLIPLAGYVKKGLAWKPPKPAKVITKHKKAVEPTGIAFFDQLGTALAQNPPPKRDDPILSKLRQVGIGVGLQPSKEHLSAAVLAGLRAAVASGPTTVFNLRETIAAASITKNNGWFVPPFINGAFGTDYGYRAVVAIYGIAANRPQEALYIVGAYSIGQHALLDGSHKYLLHFPAGQLPPAKYFWSLTMYDKNFFLVKNPINRYALGSHTKGLEHNPDGSLDIYIQSTPPAGHQSNWLPSPSSGNFEVTLRMYGPRPSALQQKYVYPPFEQTG